MSCILQRSFVFLIFVLLIACGGEYDGDAESPGSGASRHLSDPNNPDTNNPDTSSLPPYVIDSIPVDLQQQVQPAITPSFRFSESIDANSITLSVSELRNRLTSASNDENIIGLLDIPGSWTYNEETVTATFNPVSPLEVDTVYQFTISHFSDTQGDIADEPYSVVFQTLHLVTIQAQPLSISANQGEPASFTIAALGDGDLSYQWFRNGRQLPNQNSATLIIDAVTNDHAGFYSVEVSDDSSSILSESAELEVTQVLQFTLQPQSQVSDLSQPIVFQAMASSDNAVSYQWFHDDAADNRGLDDGDGGTSLSIAQVRHSDAGEYYVQATNINGMVNSLPVHLEISGGVQINSQPSSATLYEGTYIDSPFSFLVSASGTDNRVQWFRNGESIVNGTGERLYFENVNSASNASYYAVVTNDVNSEQSSTVTLSTTPGVTITQQPVNSNVWENEPAAMETAAVGTPPLTYQWYKDGTLLAGETNPTLTISSVRASDLGDYTASITSGIISETQPYFYSQQYTDIATLEVYSPPTITSQPSDAQVYGGDTHSLEVTATGSGNLSYQWEKDNAPIANNGTYSGAHSNALFISNMAQITAGDYRVIISSDLDTNNSYAITSDIAEIDFLQPPTITSQPQDITTTEGETMTLTVVAQGSSSLSYQWYHRGIELPGATSSTHTIANISKANSGVYYVVVSYSDGKKIQSYAPEVTVNGRLIITQNPISVANFPDSTASFSVTISGDNSPFIYQWQKDGQNIGTQLVTSAHINTYTIPIILHGDEGLYQVLITDSTSNQATSIAAALTLNEPASITHFNTFDQIVWEDELALFLVTASGSSPIDYQWYKNNILISGANENQLKFSNVTTADAADYTVQVSNGGSSELSQASSLIVKILPFISVQPQGNTVNTGATYHFSVTAGGDEIAYIWQKDGSTIDGETSSTLTIADITLADRGDYTVIVRNGGGEVTSERAILNVNGPVSIISHPESISVKQGVTTTLSVVATGTMPIRYQWYKDNQAISGEDGPTLTIISTSLNDAGAYHVIVNNIREIPATSTIADLEVTINYDINLDIIGSGTVYSSPLGLDCQQSISCSASFPRNTLVTLEAIPAQGYQLLGWNGLNCSSPTCTVEIKETLNISATFSEIVVENNYGFWQVENFDYLYEVGPDEDFKTPSDVPWESLAPGSLVQIHWRSEPYADKWAINTQASALKPVVILGIPNEDGDLPVISAAGATTRTELNFWNEQRVLIKVGGSNLPAGQDPSYIYIEQLEIRDANESNGFRDQNGSNQSYSVNASGILVENGSHIYIRGNEIHENGYGVFTASRAENITISHNFIYENGVEHHNDYHNAYSESSNVIYEYNHFGPLRNNARGNNIEDRSAGVIIRYNWIEEGNAHLNISNSDKDFIIGNPAYRSTYVYGNVLTESNVDSSAASFIQYGGYSSNSNFRRQGTIYIYNNTFINSDTTRSYLIDMSTSDETADIRNNVVYALHGKNSPSDSSAISTGITTSNGTIVGRHNWLQEGWDLPNLGNNVTGFNNIEGYLPGFEDFSQQKFQPATGSVLLNAATEQHINSHSIQYQYNKHQEQRIRLDNGALHVGALTRFSDSSGEPNYELAIENYSAISDAFQLDVITNNASGIAWNTDLEQYIVVQEGSALLHRYDHNFVHLGVITISGDIDSDIEGITYIGGNLFLLATERNYVHKIHINNETTDINGDIEFSQAYRLPPSTTDYGFEAIAYIPPSEGQPGLVYVAQEGAAADPAARIKIYAFEMTPDDIPKTLKDYSDGSLTVLEPFGTNIELLLAGFITDISGMTYDSRTENLIFVSQESSKAIQVDPNTGTIISQLDLTGAPEFEGVVSGYDNQLVFVSEPNWLREYSLDKVDILNHPQNATIATGENVTLTVDAIGSGTLSYQWFKNGDSIAGATSESLVLTNVSINDSGGYDVRITSSNNTTARSNTATVVVYEPLTLISTPPSTFTIDAGQSFTLTVAVAGSGPISYQWSKNGSLIPGETSSTLNIPTLSFADAGLYQSQISNIGSSVTTTSTLTITGAVEIIQHPASATITQDNSVTFEVLASGAESLSYQWRKEALNINNANGSTIEYKAPS